MDREEDTQDGFDKAVVERVDSVGVKNNIFDLYTQIGS